MQRVTGFVRAQYRQQANTAVNRIDPTNVGDIFSVPLRRRGDETFTVAAYAMSWLMPDERQGAVIQALRDSGFHPTEAFLIDSGQQPDLTKNLWLFDGDVWAYDDALTALDLDKIERKPG